MSEDKAQAFPASIVKILSPVKLVINRGSNHDVKPNSRFLIYSLGDEILTDPETGKSLGKLEIVKGTGRVTHVQEKIATLESDQKQPAKRTIIKRTGGLAIFGVSEEEELTPSDNLLNFEEPEIGDKAKPI